MVVVLSVTGVFVTTIVAVSMGPGFYFLTVSSLPSMMNLRTGATVNSLISPVEIRTSRVLPSTYSTTPFSSSVVTAGLPETFSLVVCGICAALCATAGAVAIKTSDATPSNFETPFSMVHSPSCVLVLSWHANRISALCGLNGTSISGFQNHRLDSLFQGASILAPGQFLPSQFWRLRLGLR